MKYRPIFIATMLACARFFAPPASAAEECGPLKLVTAVKLIKLGQQRLVPVTINDVPKALLLDTGGYMSQLSRDSAQQLKLSLRDSAIHLADVSGNVSRSFVIAETLKLGTLTAQKPPLMISPGWLSADGILSSDLLMRYDVEMDFPGGKLNYFSPDHCKGRVVYWKADAVAAVPITIKDKSRIIVPVKLDGQEFKALIDTGAFRTTITVPTAKRVFDLTPDSPGMKPLGNINGDPKLASFSHRFSTLSFEGITVNNPTLAIMPDRVATADRTQQTESRARTNGDFYQSEENMILGMDVMRHLRMYMAFKESTLYISAGTAVSDATTRAQSLASLDEVIAISPNNASFLNRRCFQRGLAKINLEGALADCELSLKLKPGDSETVDSKGLVLYQLGKYQDAVSTYDEALKISPKQAPSLFVRGLAKRKLGDAAGGDTDIAAAKELDPDVLTTFSGSDIAPN